MSSTEKTKQIEISEELYCALQLLAITYHETVSGIAEIFLRGDEVIGDEIEIRGDAYLHDFSSELRGLGRLHVFPGDDVGGQKNLQRWLQMTEHLDYEGVRRTLARWSRYGGLVYFHLLLDRLAEAGHVEGVAPLSHPPTQAQLEGR